MRKIVRVFSLRATVALLLFISIGCSRLSSAPEPVPIAVAVDNYNRGCVLFSESRYDEAIIEFDRAIEIDSEYAAAYSYRGAGYRKTEWYDLATADLNRAIELDSNCAHAYYNRGLTYSKKGEYDLAIADYNKAIELDPGNAYAYCNRGDAYFVKGQVELAMADYDKAFELGAVLKCCGTPE